MIRRRSNSKSAQRGAVLVELTLVVPFLITMVLGTFEIGMAWSANQTVVQSARGGARTVSQLGQNNQADHSGLRNVMATFGSDGGSVQRVVVFDAGVNGDGSMPSSCVTALPGYSGGANCNVYGPLAIAALGNNVYFDAAPANDNSCGGAASSNWCPAARSDAQASATYVGVYVEVERDYLTGFFGGGTYTITETTIMRVEPRTQ